MNINTENFFALLRYAIGTSNHVPTMSFSEIKAAYGMAREQSLVGVLYTAMEKSNVRPTDIQEHQDEFEDLLMTWMGEKVKIERRNKKLNKDTVEVMEWLDTKGFETCLLKGQGNALFYPNPSLRVSGDIDLLVRLKAHKMVDQDSRRIITFVRKNGNPKGRALYHHIHGLEWNNVEVEMHYRPSFMLSFVHNRRLQRFFLDHADEQFSHTISIDGHQVVYPTDEFNIVYQIEHIYRHLFREGIGLRQIVDYYYLLRHYADQPPKKDIDWNKLLDYLGLRSIAGAIMWILTEKLGIDSSYAVVMPDERRGHLVLNEILLSGNFGYFDKRNAHLKETQVGRNVERFIRDLRLVRYFPSEALSEPFFRLWHAWWRRKHN